MVFAILMTVAVAGMMVAMALKDFAHDYVLATFFFTSAASVANGALISIYAMVHSPGARLQRQSRAGV
jgi:hypothetical protein